MYEINLVIKYFCSDKMFLVQEYVLKFSVKPFFQRLKDLMLFFPHFSLFFDVVLFVIYERELESFESLIVLICKYPFTNMDHTKMLELKIQVQNDENNIN